MSSWLYTISNNSDRVFRFDDGTEESVTIEAYKRLVKNGKLQEDKYWYIRQNYNKIELEDDIYIYTGHKNLGIIGYATVTDKECFRENGKNKYRLELDFKLDKCDILINQPIPAQVIRGCIRNLRNSVVNLNPFKSEILSHLQW